MGLLLDTHVVLWWLADDPALPDEIKDQLDHEPDAFVSAATIWEVAIKQAIGKLPEPAGLPELVRDCGFAQLPINAQHAITAARLPLIHRDPFDRMLVAQAQDENLTLVTRDPRCQRYEVSILSVLSAACSWAVITQPAQLPVRNSHEIPTIMAPDTISDTPASHRLRLSQMASAMNSGHHSSASRATDM
jgi:PIN domain nuclease of toxin-antitoxin system